MVVSGLGWITGPFLRAGAGAACFTLGTGPGGLAGVGLESERDAAAPVCLVARFGARGWRAHTGRHLLPFQMIMMFSQATSKLRMRIERANHTKSKIKAKA